MYHKLIITGIAVIVLGVISSGLIWWSRPMISHYDPAIPKTNQSIKLS